MLNTERNKVGRQTLRPLTVRARCAAAFSLIELLVVVSILAILIAIVVPSLISSQPARSLASSSERLGLDMKYAMQTAQSTGNDVIVGFDSSPYTDPIPQNDYDRYFEGPLGSDGLAPTHPDGSAVQTPYDPVTGRFVSPGNPGTPRIAGRYYIIEARKRWRDEVIAGITSGPNYKRSDEPSYLIPYTYLDWLNLDDAYNGGRATSPPVEPLFPYVTGIGQPRSGDFNAYATPRYVYPMHISDTGTTPYDSRFLTSTPIWSAGNDVDQACKMFCAADRVEILGYDQNPVTRDSNGLRVPGAEDSPLLGEQIVDYTLLKEVNLPEHVLLVNPTHNYWPTDFDSATGNTLVNPSYQDMQFLQHLWVFHPSGEISLADWGYDSMGNSNLYVHGQIVERKENPQAHCMWLTTDEAAEDLLAVTLADVKGNRAIGTTAPTKRKTQQDMNGRLFVLWPLNGQYEVLDYAPNDRSKSSILTLKSNGRLPAVQDGEVLKKRELGYNQAFLSGR